MKAIISIIFAAWLSLLLPSCVGSTYRLTARSPYTGIQYSIELDKSK